MSTIETRHPAQLRCHPLNEKVYGDTADADLVDSILKKGGILIPLLITQKDEIIAGHRRHDAAMQIGLTSVPVIVSELTDELDIREALVESNRQRVKTPEQIAREAQTLMEIEKERAKQRSGKKETPVANLPPVQPAAKGKSRDVVGKKLGISGKQVEKAVAVVEKIDQLEAAGQKDEADEIRTTLNESSIHAAHQKATKPTVPKPAEPVQQRPDERRERMTVRFSKVMGNVLKLKTSESRLQWIRDYAFMIWSKPQKLAKLLDELRRFRDVLDEWIRVVQERVERRPKHDVVDDQIKFRELLEQVESKWSDADRAEMRQFFRQLANEIGPTYQEAT